MVPVNKKMISMTELMAQIDGADGSDRRLKAQIDGAEGSDRRRWRLRLTELMIHMRFSTATSLHYPIASSPPSTRLFVVACNIGDNIKYLSYDQYSCYTYYFVFCGIPKWWCCYSNMKLPKLLTPRISGCDITYGVICGTVLKDDVYCLSYLS